VTANDRPEACSGPIGGRRGGGAPQPAHRAAAWPTHGAGARGRPRGCASERCQAPESARRARRWRPAPPPRPPAQTRSRGHQAQPHKSGTAARCAVRGACGCQAACAGGDSHLCGLRCAAVQQECNHVLQRCGAVPLVDRDWQLEPALVLVEAVVADCSRAGWLRPRNAASSPSPCTEHQRKWPDGCRSPGTLIGAGGCVRSQHVSYSGVRSCAGTTGWAFCATEFFLELSGTNAGGSLPALASWAHSKPANSACRRLLCCIEAGCAQDPHTANHPPASSSFKRGFMCTCRA